jgi:molecular chaperone GrpE
MAKNKNRHDLIDEIEDPFLDDPEDEGAEEEISVEAADRDRRDAELYGGTRLARDLLSVYDNFNRALGNSSEAVRAAAPGLFEGIELTRRDLLNVFEKHKIVQVSPEAGDRFDPKVHQAMFEAPMPGTKAGDIIQVMNDGFMIGDRLLRPAQVGVSSGAPGGGSRPADTGTG